MSTLVVAALDDAVAAGDLVVAVPRTVDVQRPKSRAHGDYATNVALRLAREAGRPPREVGQVLARRLAGLQQVADASVAGPGFVNVRLAAAAQGETVRTVLRAGDAYGRTDALAGQHVNVEFVSANPTGPLHVGGVRWAAVGDSLARLLSASGAAVTREYYFNDAGVQVEHFAESLDAAARGRPTPPDGYAGDYVADVAAAVVTRVPDVLDLPRADALAVFAREGVAVMFEEITASLQSFGVDFDVWFSERTLHTSGALDAALRRLREQGHVYDADGAVWLRTTDFADDKDRVLVKSDRETTYFAADAAYYLDKRRRGADRVLLLLGADHHGYVGRMRALAACFGDDPDETLEILIGQLVNVLRGGEPVRMSKRAGTVLTLDELVGLVGVDAARYSLARSSTDSTLDLDVDVVTRQSSDNPVFYVQYAAARTAGVAREAAGRGVAFDLDDVDLSLLDHPRENALLGTLAEFPTVVSTAAALRAPHRVARFLEEQVAPAFHRFYDECRVIPREGEPGPVNSARLALVSATRSVLAGGLGLLGVAAPERM